MRKSIGSSPSSATVWQTFPPRPASLGESPAGSPSSALWVGGSLPVGNSKKQPVAFCLSHHPLSCLYWEGGDKYPLVTVGIGHGPEWDPGGWGGGESTSVAAGSDVPLWPSQGGEADSRSFPDRRTAKSFCFSRKDFRAFSGIPGPSVPSLPLLTILLWLPNSSLHCGHSLDSQAVCCFLYLPKRTASSMKLLNGTASNLFSSQPQP